MCFAKRGVTPSGPGEAWFFSLLIACETSSLEISSSDSWYAWQGVVGQNSSRNSCELLRLGVWFVELLLSSSLKCFYKKLSFLDASFMYSLSDSKMLKMWLLIAKDNCKQCIILDLWNGTFGFKNWFSSINFDPKHCFKSYFDEQISL